MDVGYRLRFTVSSPEVVHRAVAHQNMTRSDKWILPVSGYLMIIGNRWWPVFALVGGAVYLYIPGCFSITRFVLGKRGLKIGTRSAQITAYVLAVLWTVDALVIMCLAVKELSL